jgi:putative tricarboxylic transport membrane protein
MPPTSAIIMLSCICWGARFGGAIASILFNMPGEPWSAATTFDGYPLAQQGRAGEALTAAFTSSFFGALAAVGQNPVTCDLRMIFGWYELPHGFDPLIALIGLFGLSEILLTRAEGLAFEGTSARINSRIALRSWARLPRYWMTSTCGSIVDRRAKMTP